MTRSERGAALAHIGVRKESSGYALSEYARSGDLVDVLVGSEGTLAVFVGIELGLAPLPAASASLLASFSTLEGAVHAAARAAEFGASAVELLDRTFLEVVRSEAAALAIPAATEAVLLLEAEGGTPAEADTLALRLAERLPRRGRGAGGGGARRGHGRAHLAHTTRGEPDPQHPRPAPGVDAAHRGRRGAPGTVSGLRALGCGRRSNGTGCAA